MHSLCGIGDSPPIRKINRAAAEQDFCHHVQALGAQGFSTAVVHNAPPGAAGSLHLKTLALFASALYSFRTDVQADPPRS